MDLQKKKKIIYLSLASLFIFLLASFFAIIGINKYYLELNVPDKTIILEYNVDKMPEISALYKGTLIRRKGVPVETNRKGKINLKKLGTYFVTYTAEYKGLSLSEERTIKVVDTLPPVIELVSNPDYYTSPGVEYVEEGFSAVDNHDGDLTDQVIREEKNGTIIYTVTDSSGNTAKIKRKINYKDVVAPTITLTGGEEIQFTIGQDFVDPGYSATDDCDGDLTSSVIVDGNVDGHKDGTYILTYRVSDSCGNICEIKRTVKVGDFTPPVLTLLGESRLYVKVGTTFVDPGFTAVDNIDGNISDKVSVSGGVATSKMGRYTLTYTATDTAGNSCSVTRSIFVYEKQAQSNVVNPGNNVVYLTFDDGPGIHTARLLDILDKYGVKATFFVTNQFPAYQNMIGETYRRGHTIALHTYSHAYNTVYCNEDAYYNDLALINNICINQTGIAPSIVRFPGGTNNTVSKNYCQGIMTSLTQSISYHGYLYCDWNVSSGDAGAANTRELVAANVIAGIQRNSVSVVLQHDIKGYSVDAVDDIIFWGLENGYTFLPLTTSSPMVHFAPQN